MSDYKKDIIMVYHMPVDGLSRQKSAELIYEFSKCYTTGDFYKEMFIPYTGGKEKIIKIEIINLKDNKTENVKVEIEKLEDLLMKYFDHNKWLRKQKLTKILK